MDILFVNCTHWNWKYIPMGVFGLCDFLSKRGFEAQILNLATVDDPDRTLEDYVTRLRPRFIGIPFHWLQVIEAFVHTVQFIKSRFPDIPIVTGGLSASFFGERVLREIEGVDYVIVGDAFHPLARLLAGEDAPALIAGEPITQEELSEISFTDLGCLIERDVYVSTVSKRLHFPVFLKRGCGKDCPFCGGTAAFFRQFYGCAETHRSMESVKKDLASLLKRTNRIYLYADTDYLKALLRELTPLKGRFYISLGVDLDFDEELIRLYRDTSLFDGPVRLEISPENLVGDMYVKSSADKIKVEDFWRKVDMVLDVCDGKQFTVDVYFSKYHENHDTVEKLHEVSDHILEKRWEYFLSRTRPWKGTMRVLPPVVRVIYMNLSTDPGSEYWHKSEAADLTLQDIARDFVRTERTTTNWNRYLPKPLQRHDVRVFDAISTSL